MALHHPQQLMLAGTSIGDALGGGGGSSSSQVVPMPLQFSLEGAMGGLSLGQQQLSRGMPQLAVALPVPENTVGAVIGRNGRKLKQFKEQLNVKVVVADRSQMDPNTRTRNVSAAPCPACVSCCVGGCGDMWQQLVPQGAATSLRMTATEQARDLPPHRMSSFTSQVYVSGPQDRVYQACNDVCVLVQEFLAKSGMAWSPPPLQRLR
jgi:hypothetical protein